MKKLRWRPKFNAHGQSIVEFTLVLPLLLLLLLGVAEMGVALYNYLSLATANREGVRLASRARFTDEATAGLIVSSSGMVEQPDGTFVPVMKLSGADANLGVIITHISIDTAGNLLDASTYISGTIMGSDHVLRPITLEDSRFTAEKLEELVSNSLSATSEINAYREDMSYDMIPEELVVIETFLTHHWISSNIDAITLYFHSVMRVLRDSRDALQGG